MKEAGESRLTASPARISRSEDPAGISHPWAPRHGCARKGWLRGPQPARVRGAAVFLLVLLPLLASLAGCENDDGTGPGEEPDCTLVSSLDFGPVTVGECSDTVWATLANRGTGTLRGSLESPCPAFTLVRSGGAFSLAPGESLFVGIRFCPEREGSDTCGIGTGTELCGILRCTGVGLLPVGACCDPSSWSCTLTRHAECASPRDWLAPWSDCDPNPCPKGACCKDENCTLTAERDCLGAWRGAGTLCSPNPCMSDDTGACCAPGGACSLSREEDCAPPAVWHREWRSCDPDPCPQPLGACCDPAGNCMVTVQPECSGLWNSSLSSCLPNPCPRPEGACCDPGGSCRITTAADCSGLWMGALSLCDPDPCPGPVGACCVPNGVCNLTTERACAAPRSWNGALESCHPNPCPQPPLGACCVEEACGIDNRFDCESEGGIYEGDGISCAPCTCTPCPPSPRSLTCTDDVSLGDAGPIPDACEAVMDRVGFDSEAGEVSALLRFDVGAIPRCATVTGASLELYGDGCDPASESGRVTADLSRVTQEWHACSVSGTGPSSVRIGECAITLYCAPASYFAGGCPELAAVVQDWVDHPESNFGLRLYPARNDGGAVRFHSRRHGEGQSRPRLVVSFNCPQAR